MLWFDKECKAYIKMFKLAKDKKWKKNLDIASTLKNGEEKEEAILSKPKNEENTNA